MVGDEIEYKERIVVDPAANIQQTPSGPRLESIVASYDKVTLRGSLLDKLPATLKLTGVRAGPGTQTVKSLDASRDAGGTPEKAVYTIEPLASGSIATLLSDGTPLLSPVTVDIENPTPRIDTKEIKGKTLTLTGEHLRLLPDGNLTLGSKTILLPAISVAADGKTATYTLSDTVSDGTLFSLSYLARQKIDDMTRADDKAKTGSAN